MTQHPATTTPGLSGREAERLADEAIPWADRSDELNNQAEVRTDAAEVYRLTGRLDKAVTALQEALARFEQKGNVVMTEFIHEECNWV